MQGAVARNIDVNVVELHRTVKRVDMLAEALVDIAPIGIETGAFVGVRGGAKTHEGRSYR